MYHVPFKYRVWRIVGAGLASNLTEKLWGDRILTVPAPSGRGKLTHRSDAHKMVYQVTWTTHKGDGINPARQVTEEFNTESVMGGVSYTTLERKVRWLKQNGITYTITPEVSGLAV